MKLNSHTARHNGTSKALFRALGALAFCTALVFAGRAAMQINPCYKTTSKTCYITDQNIYNSAPFSCFGYQCIRTSWYINYTVRGTICYTLMRPPYGDPPTGRTNCISGTLAHWGTKTVVTRDCSRLYGCYVVSTDPNVFCSVNCDNDHLDLNSPECNPE